MNPESTPTDHRLRQLAMALIDRQSTMTLATTGDGGAWAAPVYYVFHKGAFFFFSSPRSRHITEATAHPGVGAAIYPATDSWQAIQGIQMSGGIHHVATGIDAIPPVKAYFKRYPFVGEFFTAGEPLDLGSLTERFNVKFYRFEPDIVFYLDNRIRFGFRAEVKITR